MLEGGQPGGNLHVISVFALTVMGTFEVLTAAQIPALLMMDQLLSLTCSKPDYSQDSHTQKKGQQQLLAHTQLQLPHDINRDKSESEIQERPVTLDGSNQLQLFTGRSNSLLAMTRSQVFTGMGFQQFPVPSLIISLSQSALVGWH